MRLFSMSLDLAPESQKEIVAKSFKLWTITYNSEEKISNFNNIQNENNI